MDKLMEKKAELEKRENKGFTLMEMLIVVAIIAVLIAIAIPVFTGQLEKARDTTSAANIRSAYAQAQAAYLTEQSDATNGVNVNPTTRTVTVANVKFEGTQKGWSGATKDLPNGVDWVTGLGTDADSTTGGDAGNYTLTFTYPAANAEGNDALIKVAAAKQTA